MKKALFWRARHSRHILNFVFGISRYGYPQNGGWVTRNLESNGFDALRALFAVLVLISHSLALIDGTPEREWLYQLFGRTLGEIGVIGFFVLSGYLITKSWRGNPDFVAYMRNRALRIVPGFWVAAGVSVAIVGAIGAADATAYLAAITWSDIAQVIALGDPTTPPTFENLPFPLVNGSLWTIQYEFLCYLLAPLALSRRSAVIPIWLLTVGFAMASPDPLPRFLMAFMTGAVFQTVGARQSNALILLAAATFALLIPFERTWEVGAAVGGGYLALCVGQKSLPFSWPDFSYGLYLYGWPTQMLLISAGILNSWILLALALPIASALGLASWHFVERPMLRLKRQKLAPEGLETERLPVGGSQIASAV